MDAKPARIPRKRTGRAAALLGATALLLVVAGALAGCKLVGHSVTDRTPRGCAECHREIACQWQQSAHAEAWTGERFREATGEHEITGCLPCHAPEPLLEQPLGQRPTLRPDHRECGVDCNSCHAYGCAYAGPYRTFGPHEMHQDTTRLRSSQLCASCHEAEYKEYTDLYLPSLGPCDSRKECAGCHMPTYRSRLTQDHLLSLIHPKHVVHSHALSVWDDAICRGAIEVGGWSARTEAGKWFDVAFTLTNRGAGHAIPTGKFGDRQLRVAVELLGEAGNVLAVEDKKLVPQRGLVPGQPESFEMRVVAPLAVEPAKLRLVAERVDDGGEFRYVMLRREYGLPAAE